MTPQVSGCLGTILSRREGVRRCLWVEQGSFYTKTPHNPLPTHNHPQTARTPRGGISTRLVPIHPLTFWLPLSYATLPPSWGQQEEGALPILGCPPPLLLPPNESSQLGKAWLFLPPLLHFSPLGKIGSGSSLKPLAGEVT